MAPRPGQLRLPHNNCANDCRKELFFRLNRLEPHLLVPLFNKERHSSYTARSYGTCSSTSTVLSCGALRATTAPFRTYTKAFPACLAPVRFYGIRDNYERHLDSPCS